MSLTAMRKQLHSYIDQADHHKIKAIYTLLEKEFEQDRVVWTKELSEELDKREMDLDTGSMKGVAWTDVQEKVRQVLAKVHEK
jgi:hypothetical protein